MIGAVQLGVLAACVVLFVPMGMAGWHLSRNKMLFFSGALFITLAVGVHLSPYFPSISHFLTSPAATIVLGDGRGSCLSLVHDIVWDVKPARHMHPVSYTDGNTNGSSKSSAYDRELSWSWARSKSVLECDFQKLRSSDASDLLNGSWVVVAGDSQARLVVLSLLNLVLDSDRMEAVKGDLFKRHSNYGIMIPGIGLKLDFIWAPYVSNLTDLMLSFRENVNLPDVLIMGSGLWHMLHFSNASDYGVSLQMLSSSLVSSLSFSRELSNDGPVTGSVPIRSQHLFWLGMPNLINSMLNTEEKREKMNDVAFYSYSMELHKSRILRQAGGHFLLLDIHSLTQSCGPQCTEDGMHYDGAVYNAAVQIVLNWDKCSLSVDVLSFTCIERWQWEEHMGILINTDGD
ncbi:hypothetical protein BT93_H3503 [Corymbia citriodora subsp. variegata]|nr:hypothetical protein BT93_H3503 [Corymbia citriodora subsp. variegata]